MPDGDDHDQKDSVVNRVDNAVVTNSESIAVASSQRPRGRRAGILR